MIVRGMLGWDADTKVALEWDEGSPLDLAITITGPGGHLRASGIRRTVEELWARRGGTKPVPGMGDEDWSVIMRWMADWSQYGILADVTTDPEVEAQPGVLY